MPGDAEKFMGKICQITPKHPIRKWALWASTVPLGCIRRKEDNRQQVKRGDPSPLLSTDVATSRVLGSVLGSPVQERDGTTGDLVQQRTTKMIKGLKHLP
ncbi:hypothetical protein QYF61_019919 [Mycteria americana]|uniref:Uncharacterized protein n=1 Tax=Mycteria americana TaxID=33587 RepID=A0AAN7NT74_MYCAM|nr:hypothetical protein QYF61_019919 [Mycteria americana]